MRSLSLAFSVALCCAALIAQVTSAPSPDSAVPSVSEQQHILDLAGDYAEGYVAGLPNFLCEQVVREFESGRKDHWKERDTLTSRLSFVEGRERRILQLVNGKAIEGGGHMRASPLSTEGEFGLLIAGVFSLHSNADFRFSRWGELNGKRLAVFDVRH